MPAAAKLSTRHLVFLLLASNAFWITGWVLAMYVRPESSWPDLALLLVWLVLVLAAVARYGKRALWLLLGGGPVLHVVLALILLLTSSNLDL